MPSFVGQGTTCIIANGQTVSNSIVMDPSMSIVGILIPSAFTGTSLTFQGSVDNVTFAPITNDTDGTSYTAVAVAPSKFVSIPPAKLSGFPYVRVVSQAAEGGTRVLIPTVRIV